MTTTADFDRAYAELEALDRAHREAIARLTTPNGLYVVTLASVGNPDFGQTPSRSVPGVPRYTVRIATLRAARKVCRLYIDHHDLGGGNWSGGKVTRVGSRKAIAQVSYNGRVWEPGQWPTPEITNLDA
jgi:hypothetical protein